MSLATLRAAPPGGAYDALAAVLGIPAQAVMALSGSDNRRTLYTTFEVPKKRPGEFRVLHAPVPQLKAVQRVLLELLSDAVEPHKCATAFRRSPPDAPAEHGAVVNARAHCGKRLVYALDLVDFFPTILWPRVFGLLHKGPFGLPRGVARVVANLCTTADGVLPQGAPTSPLIANLVAFRLDHRLYRWARANRCAYTRYADDLAFSTDHRGLSAALRAEIDAIIVEDGFTVHEGKRRLMPYYERQIVTGLVVNNAVPSVPRETLRALRSILHNALQHGWESQLDRDLAFSSRADFLAYAAGEGSATQRVAVRERQASDHLILDAAARIRLTPARSQLRVLRVESFQRIVWGRIQYVGQVHGRDDVTHTTLAASFMEALRKSDGPAARPPRAPGPRTSGPQTPRGRSSRRNNPTVSQAVLDLGYATPQEARRSKTIRQQAREWSNAFRKATTLAQQEAVRHGAAAPLLELAQATPGLGSLAALLDRTYSAAEIPSAERLIMEVVERVAVRPEVTANFCRAFADEASFKTLLHSDNGTVSVNAALANAQAHFERYRSHIPPTLRTVARELLDRVAEALDADPHLHPYTNPVSRPGIQQAKKAVRIDADKASEPVGDSDESVHLLFALAQSAEEHRQNHPGRPEAVVSLSGAAPFRIFTDVRYFMAALDVVLGSMMENAPEGDAVHVQVSQERNRRAGYTDTHIDVFSTCQVLSAAPSAAAIFGKQGKLSRAAILLRGIATDWTITAPFSGGPHTADLLTGMISAVPTAPPDQFRHRISVRTLSAS